MDPITYFVTLNWNTTDLLIEMIRSVEATVGLRHKWIIVDNGSQKVEADRLYEFVDSWAASDLIIEPDSVGALADCFRGRGGERVSSRYDMVDLRYPENQGCIVGHNLAFDAARGLSGDRPHQIVMVDTDVVLTEPRWLSKALAWADDHPEVGIVGFEHGPDVVCAPAVFLDKSGNWYLHETQMHQAEPVEGESVGLGLALIRWPVLQAGLRFDTGYKLYYKQDDDLCFQVRADMGLEVWVYPVGNVHYGSGSLQANEYQCGDADGWDEFDKIKQANQRYFARKWEWALAGRRKNMAEEAEHLDRMRAVMRDRRGKQDD